MIVVPTVLARLTMKNEKVKGLNFVVHWYTHACWITAQSIVSQPEPVSRALLAG
jgi:hypothetical protein